MERSRAASCGAGTDEPVVTHRLGQVSVPQRLIDEVDALAQPVLGEHDIVGLVADREERIAGLHDVAVAQLERIHVQGDRQFVDGGLDRECGLCHAVSAQAPLGTVFV